MGRSRLNWWRITRYDPASRDERGAYQRETWTSICDVGATFDGVVLTSDVYLHTEDAYVNAFATFAEESEIEYLEVREFEHGENLLEGDVLTISDAREVVRRMLREEVHCVLDATPKTFSVHVGFDLYMYVGSESACGHAVRVAEELGLFVDEDFPSPWIVSD